VPDEVVVLITKNGKELLRRELIDNGVWDEMLAEMKREKIGIDRRLVFGATPTFFFPTPTLPYLTLSTLTDANCP
jgi:hypothetical protein